MASPGPAIDRLAEVQHLLYHVAAWDPGIREEQIDVSGIPNMHTSSIAIY